MTIKKKQNNETMKGQVNKGMDTSSVFTIESSASNWRESRETLTTDTHTPVQMSRRISFSSAMESGSIFSGSIGSVPSKASAALSTDALLLKHKTSSDDIEGQSTERESWDNKVQYLLAVVGFAVGLGNVWRFPYLAQKNGGGAFLIPYVIMLAIEGIPLFYLELAVGQRLRKGAIGAWNEVSPFLGGIGIACCFVSFWVALYYNTIIAWCLYYLVLSFRATLPWAACPDPVPKECNLGIQPGDVVGLGLPNIPEWILCHFGIALAGAITLGFPYFSNDGQNIVKALNQSDKCTAIIFGDSAEKIDIIRHFVSGTDDNGIVLKTDVSSLKYAIRVGTEDVGDFPFTFGSLLQ
ncbi:SLC6A15S [Mytilus coruscus]|uniref:Transporter n=1 Tax=Mytilus coruscus TaxID=42192 RepID=A0A6J8DXS0_MYTCO|nr:SLC6A15S [Mytilus coruscus]